MIITKTPFRVSLGGGSSDLPEYYEKYGGLWANGTIDKFVYVAIKDRFEPEIRLSYSKLEEAKNLNEAESAAEMWNAQVLGEYNPVTNSIKI